MPDVLHIIQQLGLGGASRALIGMARYAQPYRHTVVSLLPADAIAVGLAAEAGLDIIVAPDPAALRTAIANAAIVQFHFWNNAEIHAVLAAERPPARSIAWCHVNGLAPPHIITPEVIASVDRIVTTAAATLGIPLIAQLAANDRRCIPGGADFARLDTFEPLPHRDSMVGYIGMLDFCKLHPDYVAMSAAIDVPDLRIVVCGRGQAEAALKRQVSASAARSSFHFKGYAHDVAAELAGFDVFGYPLCENNSTTAELVLQEAMAAGVPPVVLPFGGAATLVDHGTTGLVAETASAYAHAVAHLFRHPQDRARLGRNAADKARAEFGAERTAKGFITLYDEMLQSPKRTRTKRNLSAGPAPNREGVAALLDSLGGTVPELEAAAIRDGEDQRAGCPVSAMPLGVQDMIIHYRTRYPEDPLLCLWTGLIFLDRGRPALAAAEFARSERGGLPAKRIAEQTPTG